MLQARDRAAEAGLDHVIKYFVPKEGTIIDESVRNDPAIYPPPAIMSNLFPDLAEAEQFSRLLNRSWTRLITG
jgi:putrescine transport system substrate-binding protein